jgi:hypothetical protein
VRADVLCLVDGMEHTPAFAHGRHGNILAWNEAAGRFLGNLDELPPHRRSWPHLALLDGPFRSMIEDAAWEPVARRFAAFLRLSLSRYPGDPEVAAVVASLRAASAGFDRLWAEHLVAEWPGVTCRLRHPVAGDIEIAIDVMKSSGAPEQWVVTFTTEPGSPSREALRRLAA